MNKIEELLREFEREYKKEVKQLKEKSKIENSEKQAGGEWIRKVVDKIKISDLAIEFDATTCPYCSYPIDFDNSRGFFICRKAKYSGKSECSLGGNIVEFCRRFSGW